MKDSTVMLVLMVAAGVALIRTLRISVRPRAATGQIIERARTMTCTAMLPLRLDAGRRVGTICKSKNRGCGVEWVNKERVHP
jgi:hypothetical protein